MSPGCLLEAVGPDRGLAHNLESVLTYEGTSEIHQMVIGQAVTGHAAFRG